MTLPLVTICIPTFNRAQYLAQTIESALNQDYKNLQVIVADNCSSDGTQALVKQFEEDRRFTYYRNSTNIGMVNNWKDLLFNKVSGEWFLLLSDDDYLIDDSYISEAMALANENSEVNLIYADGYLEYTATNIRQELNLPYKKIEDGKAVFMSTHQVKPQAFTLCNVLFRAELSKRLNAFSNANNLCCDSELFLKTSLSGSVGIIKKYVSVYRIHSNNLIAQKRTFEELVAMATDVFIAPQVMARELGVIPNIELNRREKNVVIPSLKKIIYNISLLDPQLLQSAILRIDGNGIGIQRFFKDPIFVLMINLTKMPLLFIWLRSLYKAIIIRK